MTDKPSIPLEVEVKTDLPAIAVEWEWQNMDGVIATVTGDGQPKLVVTITDLGER